MFVSYLKGNQEFLTGISMVITTSVFNKADSGPGLLPEEESSPRLWRSRTSSAICRPILLTSTWLEINLSNPPLPTIIFRRVKRNEFNQVKYNHANYTKYFILTLCKVVVIALNTGILRSVPTTCDRSGVIAEHTIIFIKRYRFIYLCSI